MHDFNIFFLFGNPFKFYVFVCDLSFFSSNFSKKVKIMFKESNLATKCNKKYVKS